jgi:hypothetical protein
VRGAPRAQVSSIYPLAIIHVLGNVLTNVSLGKVAVSFTHTVKVSGARGAGRGVCVPQGAAGVCCTKAL